MAAAAAPRRQTRGRQKIPMRLIQSQDDLYASFSKRRLGLFKKAGELCTLCGADIGIIVFSPTDNPFSFFSPNMESVIERYVNPDQPLKHSARALDAHARARIEEQNKQLDQLLEQKLKLKEIDEGLAEIDRTRQKGWWEETSVESLSKEQVGEWIAWFDNFKHRVENQIQQQQNGGSSSSMNQQLSVSILPDNAPADQFVPQHDQDGTAAAVTTLLNLSGSGSGDHQCYYPSPPPDMYGGGESSQYLYRPPPSPYFSPQYRYYDTLGAQDPYGGCGEDTRYDSEQCGFPPTYTEDPSGVGQHFQPVNPSTSPPHHHHINSQAQSLSNAGENSEHAAGTSNQEEN